MEVRIAAVATGRNDKASRYLIWQHIGPQRHPMYLMCMNAIRSDAGKARKILLDPTREHSDPEEMGIALETLVED